MAAQRRLSKGFADKVTAAIAGPGKHRLRAQGTLVLATAQALAETLGSEHAAIAAVSGAFRLEELNKVWFEAAKAKEKKGKRRDPKAEPRMGPASKYERIRLDPLPILSEHPVLFVRALVRALPQYRTEAQEDDAATLIERVLVRHPRDSVRRRTITAAVNAWGIAELSLFERRLDDPHTVVSSSTDGSRLLDADELSFLTDSLGMGSTKIIELMDSSAASRRLVCARLDILAAMVPQGAGNSTARKFVDLLKKRFIPDDEELVPLLDFAQGEKRSTRRVIEQVSEAMFRLADIANHVTGRWPASANSCDPLPLPREQDILPLFKGEIPGLGEEKRSKSTFDAKSVSKALGSLNPTKRGNHARIRKALEALKAAGVLDELIGSDATAKESGMAMKDFRVAVRIVELRFLSSKKSTPRGHKRVGEMLQEEGATASVYKPERIKDLEADILPIISGYVS